MSPVPDDPTGRELALIIERAKYERWLFGETNSLIVREFNNVIDTLLSKEFRTLGLFEQRRKLQLFRELERQITKGYAGVSGFQIREMKDYADLESEVAKSTALSLIPAGDPRITASVEAFLPSHTIQSIAALPIQGLRIGDWWSAQAQTMSLQTRRIIQSGLLEGKGTTEISRFIIAAKNATGPSLDRRAIQEARALTRTTVTAVQNDAAALSYNKLPNSISDSYRYVAIRDSRTSAICRALDGRIYRNDDPKAKRPPQHINCRSSVSPIIKGFDPELNKDPNAAPTFASYNEWLKSRSSSEQDKILGKFQAEQWRSGNMTLADAIDDDNRVLNVKQLRQKLGL